MEKYLDKSLDNQFDKIIDSTGLNSLPWIGSKFIDSGSKLLIVGESHYTRNDNLEKNETEKNETRDAVLNLSITNNWGKNSTLENLIRTLLGTNINSLSDTDIGEVWSKISYYNFVQRRMNYNRKERPNWIDYSNGWESFIPVIETLKPKVCLFVGVEASNFLADVMSKLNLKYSIMWDKKISRTYSRIGSIEIKNNPVRLIFIQHTSKMFSWQRWHNYLREKMSNELYSLFGISTDIIDEPSESIETETDLERVKDIPTWLGHKPIIVSNYEDFVGECDAKFLSLGHAQYNQGAASVKLWRHTGSKWSRQSEEVPIHRIFDMALILANAIKELYKKEDSNKFSPSIMKEAIIAEDDKTFLRDEIDKNKARISQSGMALREILNEIDFN